MDEDSPPPTMALSEEPFVLTSSECPNASTSSVDPTNRSSNENPVLQLEGQCTLDTIRCDRYSPIAPMYFGGQPTSSKGVNEATIGRGPCVNDKTQHTIGSPPDQ